MRCDNCPLCPIAEDDVCAIAESEEWGIEHKDGMMGCKHPRNWCEKKADEYAKHLGEVGREMGMMMNAEMRGFREGRRKTIDEIYVLCMNENFDTVIEWLQEHLEEGEQNG